MLAGASAIQAAPVEQISCINAGEYAQLKRRYDDYQSRFGLAVVARELLDFDGKMRELRAQLTVCRKAAAPAGEPRCEPLARQLEDREREQPAVTKRFNTALEMQEYLSALELRLERPQCKE